MTSENNKRILLVDDSPAIHEDFHKILEGGAAAAEAQKGLSDARAAFLGGGAPKAEESASASAPAESFELDDAMQGEEGFERVKAALERGEPYAMAFVDVRMPPGWDGIRTIERMFEVDEHLQVVVCTAFSDYSYEDMIGKLGVSDRLLILKKPFDPIEIRQLASSLTEKWNTRAREHRLMGDLRVAEQEARSYASSLETMNRALETSKAASDKLSEMATEFLVHLSNEVHGRMSAVLGEVAQMQDPSLLDATNLARLEGVVDSSQHLILTLDEILDITMIESGRIEVELQPISPREVLDDVVAELRPRAEAKGLALAMEEAGPVPALIESEPVRLRQVLFNLVENAIEYTEHGSVRVVAGALTSGSWDDAGLSIQVSDTGPGIPRDRLGTIFEPISRLPEGTTGRKGTGFGLALSKRLARLLGGELSVRSEVGQGTTFVLALEACSVTAG